jgi:hypothetical protein
MSRLLRARELHDYAPKVLWREGLARTVAAHKAARAEKA